MSDKYATAGTYVGSSAAVFGALSLNDWVMVGGFVLALLTFVYNVYYKERMYAEFKKKDTINIVKEE